MANPKPYFIIRQEKKSNWHYARMFRQKITWHVDKDFVWYNLQSSRAEILIGYDRLVIMELLRRKIPFEYQPNGNWPRIKVYHFNGHIIPAQFNYKIK